MIAFWAIAALLSAATAILILYRASRAAGREPVDTTNVFYRRQLAEIGELADRGLLGEGERKSAEAEAGRRLLAAADAPDEAWTAEGLGAGGRLPVLIAAVAAPLLALGLYLVVGAPGRADQPFEGRLAQWMAANPQALAPQEMAAVLSRLTSQRPNDPEGFRFLALAEAASDNPAAAVRAVKRALRIAPGRADLWEMLGEAEMIETGGQVNQDAQDAFTSALRIDPANLGARFGLARAQIAKGDKAGGLAAYRAILAQMPPGDPRAATVKGALDEAEAGPQPSPPAFSGDQMGAIRGMVANLAARLQTSPENPDGWVRLVRAYAVLGETDKRDAALKSANARYAGKPEVLEQLKAAAAAPPMQTGGAK